MKRHLVAIVLTFGVAYFAIVPQVTATNTFETPAFCIAFLITVFGEVELRANKPGSAADSQAAPAVIPFADGLSVQSTASNETVFARQADGTYVGLQLQPSAPFTLVSPKSAVTQWLSGGVSTLLGAPTGPAGTGVQSQPSVLSTVFSNGYAAYAAAGVNDASVSISLTSGAAAALFPIGPDVNSLLFADFNGDGNPDLAVAFDGSVSVPGGIAVLLGKSNGAFSNPVLYATGTPATRFAVLDFNHDGVPDIATVSLDQMVTVLIGKGDGTFKTPVKYPVGGSGQAIAIADFNGDGNPDIAVGGTAGVLLGKGDGTFQSGAALPAAASGSQIWAFAAGDLNADGKIDLVYADISNQVVVPLFGNGDGTFRSGQAYAVSQLPDFIVLADYNHDGRLDIVNGAGDQRFFGVSDNSGDTDILLNNGDGTFQGVPAYFPLPNSEASGTSTSIGGVATGKFGGKFQGVLTSGTGLTLFPGDGKGGLQTPQAIPFSGPARAVVAADFNGDGMADAAVANGGNVAILMGNATGFATPATFPAGGSFATALAAGDFDGDGKVDLAVMTTGTPGTLSFLKGNGDGTFRAPVAIPAGVSPTSLAAADLNGDGKLDLVFADQGTTGSDGAVYVALNAGGGVFQAPVRVFAGTFPAVGIGDVNGDGKPDLVVASDAAAGGGVVDWLQGNGNGVFQAPIAIGTSESDNNAVLVQDFNGDGHADIVLADQNVNATFLAGNGDGTFSAAANLLASGEPTFLQSADLNGDGKPDLVVGGLTITILLNQAVPLVSTLNSASFTAPVAVGSIATAFGSDLANGPLASDTTLTLTDTLGVEQQCTLFYVSPPQVNFLIPASAAVGPAVLTAQSGDGTISRGGLTLSAVAPGIYAANGLAAALAVTADVNGNQTTTVLVTANASGTLVTAPISLDPPSNSVFLILYGTGIRGAALSQVSVQVAGQNLAPAYAAAAPGYPGEDQINVRLPYSLKGSGNTAVTVTAAGLQSNTVHIQIQ
jgi:uncharacterized protein (TIGR03437 family)